MRLGRDATRGVTATAQEKRGINNGGGAWENGMEWKWFRGKGGIDIVQGEIYRNKMWSVEIINSDEIRVKDIWRLEIMSKIENSKRHHLSLKEKVVIKQENGLQRAAVLTFLYKTSPRKTFLQHYSRQHAARTRNSIWTTRHHVVYNKNHYGRDFVLHATRNSVNNETSCSWQQETKYGRDVVLHATRKRHRATRDKKHSAGNETSCCVQQETQYGRYMVLQETQCGQWDIALCTVQQETHYGGVILLHATRNSTDNETSCCVQQETQYGQQDWIPTGDYRKESDVAVLQECKRNLDKENVL